MKRILPLLITAAAMLFTQAGYAQSGAAADALTEAQRDYIRGDMEGAKERFEYVLKLDPNNRTAQGYLKTIQAQEASSGKNGALEKQLTALILPKVELKEATFDTALEYLKQMATKASDGKVKVSFVVLVPQEMTQKTPVTLSLSDVPFTEVLKYLAQYTGYKFSIDKYAITVKLPSATPVPVTSDTPPTPPAPEGKTGM